MSKHKTANDRQTISKELKRAAKQSVKKARKAYKKFAEASAEAALLTKPMLPLKTKDFNDKVQSFTNSNVSELFDLAESIVRAKSTEDAHIIQREYMQSQATKFYEQSVELGNALKTAFTETPSEKQASEG